MALTIKNDETETLCRELAQLSGETITTAITVAARERLERLRLVGSEHVRAERILALGRGIAPAMRGAPGSSAAIGSSATLEIADLYDENGLPA